MQLEKGLIRESEGTKTNSTLTAILETKDARITTLEKALALMEEELSRAREASNTSPLLDLTFGTSQLNLKNQVSGGARASPPTETNWPSLSLFQGFPLQNNNRYFNKFLYYSRHKFPFC